jgi:hypothetical protein
MAEGTLGIIDRQSDIRSLEGMWMLDDDDWSLIAQLCDPVYLSELLFSDPNNATYSGCYHVRDYQYVLFRTTTNYEVRPCSRDVGKTESIKARAVSHTFRRLGEDMLVTAPELLHLEGVTVHIENRITETRLTRDFLRTDAQRTGITHKPFAVVFADGTRILGRIPHITGLGVKSMHEPDLVIDEAQDYPQAGWVEVHPTVIKDHTGPDGKYDFTYLAYGVHVGGTGGQFGKISTSGAFKVTAVTCLQKPGWNKAEKEAAIAMYGGVNTPDYRRNILGEKGQSLSQFFVTSHLMACFQGDTLVATSNGPRPIAELRAGDRVLNASGEGPVLAARASEHGRVAVVKLNGEEIVCSPEHPFFSEGGWCRADQLRRGQRIYRQSETMRGLRGGAEDAPGPLLLQDLRRELAGEHAPRRSADTQERDDDTRLRSVRQDVRAVGRGEVLFEEVHGEGLWRQPAVGPQELLDVWGGVPAKGERFTILQSQMSGREGGRNQRIETGHDDPVDTALGVWGFAGTAVSSLDGARRSGGGVVRPVLYCPLRWAPWRYELHTRPGAPRAGACGGSGRSRSWCRRAAQEGRGARRVAGELRVDGVEIYEPGSDGWAEHCGEGDLVTLYDLTVGGHPSFAVGDSRALVHNCMDQDKESRYNTITFKAQEIQSEDVPSMIAEDGDVGDVLDLPDGLGQQVYGGMDVGLVTDPTVIQVWAVLPDSARKSRLQLIRMFHLWRFTERQIRQCTYRIARKYGLTLRAFGQDITGLGLPLYQAMESDEKCPEHLKEVSRGYVFNAKVPVSVDKNYVSKEGTNMVDQFGHIVEEVRDKWTGRVDLVARMTMIEASTRYLRGFVDPGFLLLPFHAELIDDFQGETEQRVRAMGGVKKKPNAFHMLDAARAMAMAYKSGEMEEAVYARNVGAPVFDRAVGGPGVLAGQVRQG